MLFYGFRVCLYEGNGCFMLYLMGVNMIWRFGIIFIYLHGENLIRIYCPMV